MKKTILTYCLLAITLLFANTKLCSQEPSNFLLTQSSETIYADVSQSSIVTGETLWFKIFVSEGRRFISQDLSKVAYVELIGPDGKPALQAKILLEHGSGNGSWVIPNSLSGGAYKLKAYTRWAKTYNNKAVFSKTLTVINPNKFNPNAALEAADNAVQQIAFEGNSFISTIKNTVYFTTNKGITYLLLKDNIAIDSILATETSTGSFSFIAEKSSTYALKNGSNGQIISFDSPKQQGWHFEILTIKGNEVTFKIQRTALASGSPTFYLAVHSNQELIEAQQFKSESLDFTGVFKISKPFFGIASISLLDAEKKLVAENILLQSAQEKTDFTIKTNRPSFKTREQGELSISGLDSQALSNLTIRIVKAETGTTTTNLDPSLYFSFLSKLPDLPFQLQPFVLNNRNDFDKIKPLLILYGIHNKENEIQHLFEPELSGHIITGTIRSRKTLEPVQGIRTYLTIPGDRFYFNYAQSDKQGRFAYDVKRCFGVENFIIQTNNQKDSGYIIDIDNPFLSHKGFPTISNTDAASTEAELLKRIQNAQLQNGIHSIQKDQYFLPNYNDSTPFFGKADVEYNLDDYTRFTTMEEILREYVVEVDVKKTNAGYRIRVLNVPFKELFLEDPLVLYDGVPLFDVNKVMILDPLKIRKLEVISKRFLLGAHAFDGVINLTSYKKDMEGIQLDPRALVVEYQGLQLQRQFSAPKYTDKDTRNSRLPDLRTLLLWEPETLVYQKSSHKLNFTTSDVVGTYVIEISGLTNSGKIIYQTHTFNVTE